MKTKYLCPICQGQLDVDEKIVLIAKTQQGHQGLVFLHAELGNYESQMATSLNVNKGDTVDFLCPYCHGNMDFHKEKTDLAMLILVDKKGRESKVIFSKIYGTECTYHLDEDALKSYGENAKKYMDPDWYLK